REVWRPAFHVPRRYFYCPRQHCWRSGPLDPCWHAWPRRRAVAVWLSDDGRSWWRRDTFRTGSCFFTRGVGGSPGQRDRMDACSTFSISSTFFIVSTPGSTRHSRPLHQRQTQRCLSSFSWSFSHGFLSFSLRLFFLHLLRTPR